MALTDNLIAFWELQESSGTRIDAHGANDLTDGNTVGSAAGRVGTCADFEAGNFEYLTISDNAAMSCGDISYSWSFWINMESAASYHPVVSKEGEYKIWQRPEGFDFELNSSNRIRITSLSTAAWHHVVAIHDATANELRLHIDNGSASTATSITGQADNANGFYMGADQFGAFFDGLIDQVGFWKRAITTTEVTELYNGGAGLSYAAMSGAAFLAARQLPILQAVHRANYY